MSQSTHEVTGGPAPGASPVVVKPKSPGLALALSVAMIPTNSVIAYLMFDAPRRSRDSWALAFSAVALVQLVAGLMALNRGMRARSQPGSAGGWIALGGVLSTLGAVAGWLMGMLGVVLSSAGGAWGRPLRIRGKQLHPELREGSDWTRGERPSPAGLNEATRAALEALWLHDAQKEHASVPAFSRISWLLAAVGAPADLLSWSHRAAIEEIDHTERCFALAAGYAGRSHTVLPMPDLLLGGLDLQGHPFEVLATESLSDGCQLEDFNADVAAACASACKEPTTRAVLQQIAREERSHADFSWALVQWLLQRDPGRVIPALHSALAALDRYPRPTAVSTDKRALVKLADADQLREHGRLPDREWQAIWDERLQKTRARVLVLLSAQTSMAA